MVVIFFSVLVTAALSIVCSEMVMRVRVTKADRLDKWAWWRRGGDEIAATYQELFPRSKLPILREFAYWFVVTSAAVGLVLIFWKSH
jgi:hypothetical protein